MTTSPTPKRAYTDTAFSFASAPRTSGSDVDEETQARIANMAMRVRQSVGNGYKSTPSSFSLEPPSFSSFPSHTSSSSSSTASSSFSSISSTSSLAFLSDASARSLALSSAPPPPPIDSMDTSGFDLSRRRRRSPSPDSEATVREDQPPLTAGSFPAMGPPIGTTSLLLANRPKRSLRATQSMPVRSGGGEGGGWIGQMGREQREQGEWTKFDFGNAAKRDDGF